MNSEFLWAMLVKCGLVLVMAMALSLVLRRASGARRHIVWLAAMVAVLILPFAEGRLPAWKISADDSVVVRPLLAPQPLKTPKAPVYVNEEPASVSAAITTPTESPRSDTGALLSKIWLVVGGSLIAWHALGLLRVAMLIRSGRLWNPCVYVSSPLRRPVRVLLCPGLKVPATAGVFRPVLLLPESAPDWTKERLRMVVAHEVAHVQRCDWLWQSVAQLACAIHFYNPLVWIAARRLRSESEIACDDFVLATGIESAHYAQELLDMAKGARFQLANVVGMAKTPHVEGRLRAIVDQGRRRNWVSSQTLVGALVATAFVVLPIGIVQAVPPLLASVRFRFEHKGPSLPSIPWVPSKEVAPNLYLAQNGIAGLPNGVKVRLIGVAVPDNDEYWDMKGITLPDAERWREGGSNWQGNVFHRWVRGYSPSLSAFQRKFALQIESKIDMVAATCGQIVRPGLVTDVQRLNPAMAGMDDQIGAIVLPARDPAFGIIDLAIASRAETADYRVGIAGEKWTQASVTETPLAGGQESVGHIQNGAGQPMDHCGVSLSDEPEIYYTDSAGNYQRRKLLPEGQKLDSTLARRVVLLDAEGNVVRQGENPSHDNQGHEMYMPNAETFARIAKVVLFVSPYRFIEFRNVPLRPDYETEMRSRIGGTAKGLATGIATGFSKRLSNGVTVSLASVTKARLDGDNWKFFSQPGWRGDGQLLAESPKDTTFSMPRRTWGTTPLHRFNISYDGAERDVSTCAIATGDLDPGYWLSGQYPISVPHLESVTTVYRAGAKEGGVRVGVANGPWKTIASIRSDVPRLPATDEGIKAKLTGIDLHFDPLPEITFLDTNKTQRLWDKPLNDVARRFVAVTYAGEERPLTSWSSGYKGVEQFTLPARHGEMTEDYNHLLASDVKEIRLQTRPYEWVEFKGIPLEHK